MTVDHLWFDDEDDENAPEICEECNEHLSDCACFCEDCGERHDDCTCIPENLRLPDGL